METMVLDSLVEKLQNRLAGEEVKMLTKLIAREVEMMLTRLLARQVAKLLTIEEMVTRLLSM